LSGIGVATVVGTGPAVGARNADGREAWSGVWIFDSMAGIGLSDAALAAVSKAWLGIAPPTALTPALLELFDEPDVWSLVHAFRRRFDARDPRELRTATRVVMRVAAEGDQVATELVADQGRLFADYAQGIAAQAGISTTDGLPVVVNGSVATSECGVVREMLVTALSERFPRSDVIVAEAPPISGVALDALAAGGVELTESLRRTVIATSHPTWFLAT
jgi:N-acetylglucosamine kinase-like BadF-type ATPase